ncbi:MAG: LysR family transcriptional regulator [Pseudomonadota bacterium]
MTAAPSASKPPVAQPGVRTKIYVQSDMIGSGKIDLLRLIDTHGSITGAAREMGVGYRRAWFLIDTIQRCFEAPLIETHRGGPRNGSRLTPLGAELIRRYDSHTAEIEAASKPFLNWLEEHQRRGAP